MANRLTGQEMAVEFKNNSNATEIANKMSYFVNSFSIDNKGFIEGMKQQPKKVQKLWTEICLLWVNRNMWNYLKDRYDDRNKYSVNTCFKISELIGDKVQEVANSKDKQCFEMQFISAMAEDHRTLQQSFSELVFRWFGVLAENKNRIGTKVVKNMPERFFRTPLI